MNLVDQHFWLFCGVFCGVFGALHIRRRLRRKADGVQFETDEVDRFAFGYGAWILLPCLGLWLLQLTTPTRGPVEYWRWPDTQRDLAFGIQLFVWIALLWWVWFRQGADTLSLYFGDGLGAPKVIWNPISIRLFSVVAVVGGALVLIAHA